jgi:hypothetical protein
MRTSTYFFNEGTSKDANVFKINEDIEEYSNKINSYPKEKKQILMDGCRKYISYSKGMMEDMIKPMGEYYSTGKFNFVLSHSTKKLETELISTYKLKDEIESLEKAMDEQSKQINQQARSEYLESEIADLKSKFASEMTIMKSKYDSDYKRIFKNIFNEEL